MSVSTLVPLFGTKPVGHICLFSQGKIAHAIVMPSVTVEKLDDFIKELIAVRNRAFADGNVVVPCTVEEVGPENCACSIHRDTVSSQKGE